MRTDNPYATYPCTFCNGGCHCTVGTHHVLKTPEQKALATANCQECDVCQGTGELSAKQLEDMARAYRADEAFKRSWRSAV